MQSLKKLLALDACVLYPGHGVAVSEPSRHIEAYIKNRENREKQIINALEDKKPRNISEIVQSVYQVSLIFGFFS